ncbi:S8 family peptidase [Bacillus sp. AFS017336]|uniref:S8 family peptidase n=1 Tax=Bacillus sp. AFS017336 TaxID=2033489 RepID=UPI000BF0903A|nr:S8 family peptidase [Bacillus sp. AFS017336]PEL03309.1 peptidase S8 [Bacillus sp. AFS017336]
MKLIYKLLLIIIVIFALSSTNIKNATRNLKEGSIFYVQNINKDLHNNKQNSLIYKEKILSIESHHNKSIYNGYQVKVGILDTGIDFNHKDLNIKRGISLVDNSNNYIDYSGHGTLVAGIVMGLDNDTYKAKTLPEAQLFSIKALNNNGEGKISNIIAGVQWAIDNEIDILNMSVGAYIYSKKLENMLKKAYLSGIFIVSPVGNDGLPYIQYPAKFSTVFAVGSVNEYLQRSHFSNTGNELDLMAQGEKVLSTSLNNKYTYGYGTSMAAPQVAHAASILLSVDPSLSNVEIAQILRISSLKKKNQREYGYGILDVSKALDLVILKKINIFRYKFIIANNYGFDPISWILTSEFR